jgi:hypothetical protein
MAGGVVIAAAAAAVLNLCTPFHDPATDLYGFLQCDGSPGLSPRYQVANDFTPGGIAAVMDGTDWLYIDRQGRALMRAFIYDNGPDYFEEGLARFVQDGKIGFMDDSGRVVVPATLDFAFPFKDGQAEVGHDCTTLREHEHSIVGCKRWSTLPRPAVR